MADSFYFSSLGDAAEHAQAAMDDLYFQVGGDTKSFVDADTYAKIMQQCEVIEHVLHDLREYRSHFENKTTPNERELPTYNELKAFYATLSGEIGNFLSLGLAGHSQAFKAMMGRPLVPEDDKHDHLPHGAVLVEVDSPDRFLRKMEAQFNYISEGIRDHFAVEGQATSNEGALGEQPYTANLREASYDGAALSTPKTELTL